jgi:O-acetyl-ADP-ribose deacetylase (regulator of RNase III)
MSKALQGIAIHTVCPVWKDGQHGEPELLASAYRRCFEAAHQHLLKSIAFPAVSAGVYGYPMRAAAVLPFRRLRQLLVNIPNWNGSFLCSTTPRRSRSIVKLPKNWG